MSFSLAPPPSSGKSSRRERTSRSGRSQQFDTDELATLSKTTNEAAAPPAQSPFTNVVVENANPFSAAAPSASFAPSTNNLDFFTNSSSTTQANSQAADLFSFFDPLTIEANQQQQQRSRSSSGAAPAAGLPPPHKAVPVERRQSIGASSVPPPHHQVERRPSQQLAASPVVERRPSTSSQALPPPHERRPSSLSPTNVPNMERRPSKHLSPEAHGGVDPFSASVGSFDLLGGASANTASKSAPSKSKSTSPQPNSPNKSPNKKKAGDDSSSSESDSSSDDSDSSDDDDITPEKQRERANQRAKQIVPNRRLSASAQEATHTTNKPLAAGASASSSSTLAPPTSAAALLTPTMKVDVLAFMKKGCPFLKYGKSGYPHFRQFQLSDDNSRIVWFSSNKKAKDSQIEIYNITELRFGQTTPNFARHPAPDLDASSFSLMYDNGKSSLDVIAKDPNEYKIWTKGLQALLNICNGGGQSLESLKTLPIDIGIHTRRRSSFQIIDLKTGQTASSHPSASIETEAEASRPRALSTGNKQMYGEVNKNFNELKRKLDKRRNELREGQFYMQTEYPSMQTIVKRVEESVARVADWMQDGEYVNCDDEIWRAGVDLESLKNMMKAVKT